MGIEPSDKSVKQEKFEELEKQLRIMMNMFDSDEVLTVVRKVYREVKSC
jgi:flagellar biosynthesis regulator FlbT